MNLIYLILSILWFALIAYAAFGGADFGAGIWDMFAFGYSAEDQHKLIDRALGPVWETNHVWLVFLVVGLFSAFPSAFAALCIVLFIPLTLALIGSVLRGAAFIFRTHGLKAGRPAQQIWARTFSFSSIITPFFLGTSAAAVASGHIRLGSGPLHTDTGSLWLTPFALTIGFMAIALCATLAAIYLTVEATNEGERGMAESFRRRGLLAGAVTAALGALGLLLSIAEAPLLWQGMLAHALPLVIATMLIGLATAVTLFLRYYQIARGLIVIETVEKAAGVPGSLFLLLIGILLGMLITLPSIYYLFHVFKLKDRGGFFRRSSD
jgi:cytochrome d ubiquinol oxidase subunit II